MSLTGQDIGRYHLLRLLGDRELYLGQDAHIERQVVIRVRHFVGEEEAEAAAILFLDRMRRIAALDHPAIAPIYDFGRQRRDASAYCYVVVPFYQEGSLADWLRQRPGPLSPQDVTHLIARVADALYYTHEQQIVHQYVSPTHLLVRSRKEQPDRPELFLTGFELAAPPTSDNPLSMAPEQWSGQAVPATDQYALAVLAYGLLTGVPPFEGSLEQIREQHLRSEPVPPSQRNEQLPPLIDEVLLRALAKDPTQRFVSIAAFANALSTASQVQRNGDFYTTLTLNAAEARQGTRRVITLPGGWRVVITVPAGASSGQVLHLPGQGEVSTGTSRGDLFVTLEVREAGPAPALETPYVALDEPTPKRIPRRSPEATGAVHDAFTTPAGAVAPDDDITVRDITIAVPGELPANHPVVPSTPITPVLPEQAPHMRADQLVALRQTLVSSVAASAQRLAQTPWASRVRSSDTLRKILLLVLAFLVIAASGSLLYVVRVNQLVADGVQATATASIRSLATTYAATVSVQASATATVTHDPYPPGNGTQVFNDPLNGTSKSTWNQVAGECSFVGDAYEVDESQQGMNYCDDAGSMFTNFTYEVQMTITQGDAGGIVFRVDNTKNTYYYFGINTKGSYWLDYYNGSGYITILNGSSQAIRTGTLPNSLAVVASGRNIDLYVNNQHVAGISDGLYESGYIGLAAEDDGNATTVTFNNARVWNI
jgi:hypothetical protein